MNKENCKDILENKINLCLFHCLDASHSYLKFLNTQINFYEYQINYLETHKPFFFQKSKLKIHNDKVVEYQNKINDIYLKMDKELDTIVKTYEYLDI